LLQKLVAFGKVPDKPDATGLESKTTLILHYGHERPDRDEKEKPDENTLYLKAKPVVAEPQS